MCDDSEKTPSPDLRPIEEVRDVIQVDRLGWHSWDGSRWVGSEPIPVRALSAEFLDLDVSFDLRISGRDTPNAGGR